MIPASTPHRVAVTGGAGFIGSHVVDALCAEGREVVVVDNLSNSNRAWCDSLVNNPLVELVVDDIARPLRLESALAGCGLVIHLAANADIRIGVSDTLIDLETHAIGTRNVLEAMRTNGIDRLLFASTGAVYGRLALQLVSETSGPLIPQSLYGAGKIAAESMIGAYCELFELHALIFRFGNVLGARMSRGAIRDFICKLRDNPLQLNILGDGTQRKSYFLVDECIQGMLVLAERVSFEQGDRCRVINLGASGSTSVLDIARWVADDTGLEPEFCVAGDEAAWPGDQPQVHLDVSLASEMGWTAVLTSDEAAREGARRMVAYLSGDIEAC